MWPLSCFPATRTKAPTQSTGVSSGTVLTGHILSLWGMELSDREALHDAD